MRGMSSWKQSGGNPTADQQSIELEVGRIASLDLRALRWIWRNKHGRDAPKALSKELLVHALAYEYQEGVLGALAPNLERLLGRLADKNADRDRAMKIGSVIVREYQGEFHEVTIVPEAFHGEGRFMGASQLSPRKSLERNGMDHAFLGCRRKGERERGQMPIRMHRSVLERPIRFEHINEKSSQKL